MEYENYILPVMSISPQINLFDERLIQQQKQKQKKSSPSKNTFQDMLLECGVPEDYLK